MSISTDSDLAIPGDGSPNFLDTSGRDNGNSRGSKRRRVAIACTACRGRKSRVRRDPMELASGLLSISPMLDVLSLTGDLSSV